MTVILYGLAALWAIGCISLCGYSVFSDFFADTIIGKFLCACIAIPVFVCGAGFPFYAIADSTGPTLATLDKAHWQCASSHQELVQTWISSGKSIIPITNVENVCDAYTRRPQP